MRIEAGDSFCNCFSCDWHGKQSDLILDMRRLNKATFHAKYPFGDLLQMVENAEQNADLAGLDSPSIEELYFQKKQAPHVFPDWWLETFSPWQELKLSRDYLASRAVPEPIADALDLRADSTQRRVCFPVRDFSGQLMGMHGRAVDDSTEPRYRMYTQAKKNNPLIWLGEHWVDLNQPILAVEGPFDLTSVLRVYRNAVCPLFANPSEEKLKRMADAIEWVTLYDNGKGGDSGRKKVSKVMTSSVVTHLLPPAEYKDPGACSVEVLVQLLAPHLTLDEIVC